MSPFRALFVVSSPCRPNLTPRARRTNGGENRAVQGRRLGTVLCTARAEDAGMRRFAAAAPAETTCTTEPRTRECEGLQPPHRRRPLRGDFAVAHCHGDRLRTGPRAQLVHRVAHVGAHGFG